MIGIIEDYDGNISQLKFRYFFYKPYSFYVGTELQSNKTQNICIFLILNFCAFQLLE